MARRGSVPRRDLPRPHLCPMLFRVHHRAVWGLSVFREPWTDLSLWDERGSPHTFSERKDGREPRCPVNVQGCGTRTRPRSSLGPPVAASGPFFRLDPARPGTRAGAKRDPSSYGPPLRTPGAHSRSQHRGSSHTPPKSGVIH